MPLARPIGMTGVYELFTDSDVTAWLITVGLMEAAPTPPTPAATGQVLQDVGGQVFQDDDGQTMQDI